MPAIDRPRRIDTDIVTWMVESEDKSHWESLHPGDGARLESALQAGQITCIVDNGRFMVELQARTMSPVYYSADSRRVIRGSWFFFEPVQRMQTPRPLEEEDAVLVEEFFRLGTTNVELPLSDGIHNVIFEEVASIDKLGASGGSPSDSRLPDTLSSPRSRSGSIGVLDRKLSNGSNGLGPELVIAYYQRNDNRGHRVNIYRGFPDWVEDEHGNQADASPERNSDESIGSWIDVEAPSNVQAARSFFEEPKDARKIDHLVLVVHGMGENYWNRHNSLTVTSNTATFRKTVARLKKSHPSLKEDVEFLPIKWDHILHEETSIHERLDEVTLNSASKIREVANYALIDLLCYVQANHRRRICNEVVRLANDIFKKFCEKNPTFKGNVSFMAHSLGGAVMFDILRCQKSRSVGGQRSGQNRPLQTLTEEPTKAEENHEDSFAQLDFPVHSVFAMGSPAALLSVVSEVKLKEDFNLPTCKRFYNIFHPKDPVAYRMEPMLDREFKAFPPVMMEHHKGRQRMHLEIERTITKKRKDIRKGLKDTTDLINETFSKMFKNKKKETPKADAATDAEVSSSARTSFEDGEDVPEPEHGLALNDGGRVDFRLQDTLLEHHSEILASLAVHSCYWTSRDCALFMFRQIFGDHSDRKESADICFAPNLSMAPYPLGS